MIIYTCIHPTPSGWRRVLDASHVASAAESRAETLPNGRRRKYFQKPKI